MTASQLPHSSVWMRGGHFAAWDDVGGLAATGLTNGDGMDYSCSFGCITEYIAGISSPATTLPRIRPPIILKQVCSRACRRDTCYLSMEPCEHWKCFYPITPSGSAEWYLVRSPHKLLAPPSMDRWGGGGVVGSTLCAYLGTYSSNRGRWIFKNEAYAVLMI